MFKIYVGNIGPRTDDASLKKLFAPYIEIEDIAIPMDEKSERPRGFAIVMTKDDELGQRAVRALMGTSLHGRSLVINEAQTKKQKQKALAKKAAEKTEDGQEPKERVSHRPFFRGARAPRPRGRVNRREPF